MNGTKYSSGRAGIADSQYAERTRLSQDPSAEEKASREHECHRTQEGLFKEVALEQVPERREGGSHVDVGDPPSGRSFCVAGRVTQQPLGGTTFEVGVWGRAGSQEGQSRG